jgi:hypothetical protein
MYVQNPLDQFESYSVQYVMLASRTTVALQDFTDERATVMAETLKAITDTPYLGAPVSYKNSANDVFLVMDTRRFSQFTIDRLEYDVYINGLQKGGSTSNLATELKMTVVDSVGLSFSNFMQWLMDKQMKTNYDGMVFLLRVIFVGHKLGTDGITYNQETTEVIQSETIPLHLIRMDIDLNYARGVYELEFMPNMNFDVNRYSRFLTIGTATTSLSNDNKLGAMIKSLQDGLNQRAEDFYNKVQGEVHKVNPTGELGRKVQYMITIPKHWESLDVASHTAGAMSETIFKKDPSKEQAKSETTGTVKESFASTHPGALLTDALDKIFGLVPAIKEYGNFKSNDATTPGGSIKFYKHVVGITSDNKVMVIHVDVVEFEVPNVFRTKELDKKAIDESHNEFYQVVKAENSPLGVESVQPKDFIEYDFIFTGKNKDVLNFDIKIENFQFLLASNLQIGDSTLRGVTDSNGAVDPDELANKNQLLYARPYDPLMIPLDTAAALRGFSEMSTTVYSKQKAQEVNNLTQQYVRNLSMFYAASPITVALKIRGNPTIMHKFNMGKMLDHNADTSPNRAEFSAGSHTNQTKYREELERNILKTNRNLQQTAGTYKPTVGLSDRSYACSPVFAKVHLKGPNVDFRTNKQNEGAEFATSPLSENFYTVFRVTNVIDRGVFTQDLELYSHNIFGQNKVTIK